MAEKREWEHNASTGDDYLRVSANERIVRMAGGGLYVAEFWGDYSLRYPRRSGCCASLKAATAELAVLKARDAREAGREANNAKGRKAT